MERLGFPVDSRRLGSRMVRWPGPRMVLPTPLRSGGSQRKSPRPGSRRGSRDPRVSGGCATSASRFAVAGEIRLGCSWSWWTRPKAVACGAGLSAAGRGKLGAKRGFVHTDQRDFFPVHAIVFHPLRECKHNVRNLTQIVTRMSRIRGRAIGAWRRGYGFLSDSGMRPFYPQSSQARRMAAIIDDGFARPVPAMPKAVP